MGSIEAVCLSSEKGVVKIAMDQILLKQEWGIEGDAHAGAWHRQVSILAGESIDRMREKIPDLSHGMFAENIVTRGIDLSSLSVGDRLFIDDSVVIEITQIGKECHNGGCAIQIATGACIMPKEGLFCRILEGGTVKPGMSVKTNK
ncbi:MAG: MOSC domain-containing protein [Chlorobium sp.]|nr:MAG: MOSC domain-containing protein [Chlorobium sp.]